MPLLQKNNRFYYTFEKKVFKLGFLAGDECQEQV